METVVQIDRNRPSPVRQATAPRMRADDIFFPAMAMLILAVVVYGFGQSYFLPGMVFAKLPNATVHIHAALFMSWIFLMLIQNALVAARKVRWHMTLGVLGLILPPLMAIFGVLTVVDSIRRNGTGIPPELILIGDLEELSLFLLFTGWAMLVRRKAAAHKRLMILGTMAMLGPAINRWPFPPEVRIPGTIGVYAAIPLFLVAYDLWTRRRLHHTTAIAYVLMMVGIFTMVPVAQMSFSHHLVQWILR